MQIEDWLLIIEEVRGRRIGKIRAQRTTGNEITEDNHDTES